MLFNASGTNPSTAGFEANISCKTTPPIADFTASNPFLNPAWALPGAVNSGHFYIRNFSTVSVPATKAGYYLSIDTILDAQDVLLSNVNANVPAMGPYGGARFNYSFTVPSRTAVGNYFVIFKADQNNTVAESSETNNTTYGAFYVAPAIADFTSEGYTAPCGVIDYDDGRQEADENDNVFGTPLKISNTAAVYNAQNSKLAIYPNPSGGTVSMDLGNLSGEMIELTVCDAFGEIVSKKILQDNSALKNLSFASLSSGFYTVELKQGDRQYLEKVIIAK
ncbi:MAG: T9SS type A sorting domain-containing protein [Cytophagaceae bacterium]|nr:T9SS type A sorting domain-containing protein [Cytophagaceae bacterium]